MNSRLLKAAILGFSHNKKAADWAEVSPFSSPKPSPRSAWETPPEVLGTEREGVVQRLKPSLEVNLSRKAEPIRRLWNDKIRLTASKLGLYGVPRWPETPPDPLRYALPKGSQITPYASYRQTEAQKAWQRNLERTGSPLRYPASKEYISSPVAYAGPFREQFNKGWNPEGSQRQGLRQALQDIATKTLSGSRAYSEPGLIVLGSSANPDTRRLNMGLSEQWSGGANDAMVAKEIGLPESFVRSSRQAHGPILAHEYEHLLQGARRLGKNRVFFPQNAEEALRNAKGISQSEIPAVFAEGSHILKLRQHTAPGSIDDLRISAPSSPYRKSTGPGVTAPQWLRMANEHYFNKGKSMTELLGTPEAAQFLNKQFGGEKNPSPALPLNRLRENALRNLRKRIFGNQIKPTQQNSASQ